MSALYLGVAEGTVGEGMGVDVDVIVGGGVYVGEAVWEGDGVEEGKCILLGIEAMMDPSVAIGVRSLIGFWFVEIISEQADNKEIWRIISVKDNTRYNQDR